MKPFLTLLAFLFSLFVNAQQKLQPDVLVVGGGIGGTAAAIQAARMGVRVVLVEEGPWLGGMLSAAGVSAIDGNHELPSGIWGEFRAAIYRHYGGPDKVATGWVSNTQFEPHVGDSILKSMARAEKNLYIAHGYRLSAVKSAGNRLTGASFTDLHSGKTLQVHAKCIIDATELGDVMAMAKVPYSLGMEAGSTTGETVGVTETNDIVQDLTYVAILKDYGRDRDCTIAKPSGYNPAEFDGACTDYYIDQSRKKPNVSAKQMLDYGKLPNGKYMLNWPNYGNDAYLNIVEMTPDQRIKALETARQTTLRFIYFIQTQLGYRHLGLTDDEFPTADRMALMPYHREGRRLKGIVRYTMTQIAEPFKQNLFRTGISVGDYPIDHHHKKNPKAPQQLDFYPVPSFNIPLGCLIPQTINGLIVAEKGISITNVANGTTRLQPVVLVTGQAAGALAALAVKNKQQPRTVAVRNVQNALLQSGAYIMPYNDVKPDHPDFLSIQRVGATGILKGIPTPQNWANRTWFYPDSLVHLHTFIHDIKFIYPNINTKMYDVKINPVPEDHSTPVVMKLDERFLTLNGLIGLLEPLPKKMPTSTWSELLPADKDPNDPLSRKEAARLIDKILDPFSIPVNHQGDLLR